MSLALRYEVIRRLAVGSATEVCLARRTGSLEGDPRVVLKRLLPDVIHDHQRTEAFLTEARVTAQLAHANIVRVEAIDVDAHSYYYAMELVRGANLYEVMQACARRGQLLPLEASIAIAIALCDALDHAHERRIDLVHGHLCPSKVLLSDRGVIKLAGFGIAHDVRTHGYQSPEQCAGAPLDRRSDVFSVGMLLYELTTGVRLVSPTDLQPTRDARCPMLTAIITRALRADPAARYQTAAELAGDLRELVRIEQRVVSPGQLGQLVELAVHAPPPPAPPPMLDLGTGSMPPLTASAIVEPPPPMARFQRWRGLAAASALVAGIGISMIAMVRNQYEPAPPLYVGRPAPPIDSVTTIRLPRPAPEARPAPAVDHPPAHRVVAQAPAREPAVTIASLDVRGPLPDLVIRKAVEGALPGLRACYRDAARAAGGRAISLEVMFELTRTRAPSNLRTNTQPAVAGLAGCAAKTFAGLRTPRGPDAGGKARIYLTLMFRPS